MSLALKAARERVLTSREAELKELFIQAHKPRFEAALHKAFGKELGVQIVWEQIAASLGVTRQAVHKKHAAGLRRR